MTRPPTDPGSTPLEPDVEEVERGTRCRSPGGVTRRRLLAGIGLGMAVGTAGCAGVLGETGGSADPGNGPPPPTADRDLLVPYEFGRLRDSITDGGPGKDGIPSIDDPTFEAAADSGLEDSAVVFGVERNGQAKAYPQYIVVFHEIVNDVVGDTNVAVTYCPLTGTAMGFERGDTTFGTTGNLVHNNLLMYDRGTDSEWPQVLATAIKGPLQGSHLREFSVTWTTWGRWRRAHPDTVVLTEDTGYARRYGNDPYGNYNPDQGYYVSESTLFPRLHEDDRAPLKRVVIGARTSDRAVAFDKPALRDAGVLATADEEFLAAYESSLDTAFVYRNPDGRTVSSAGDQVEIDGETFLPAELPLPGVLRFDAMWFAWAGYYPETDYVT